jgi:hypothetical protein
MLSFNAHADFTTLINVPTFIHRVLGPKQKKSNDDNDLLSQTGQLD